MKIVTLKEMFNSIFPAIVEQGLLDGVNTIIVDRGTVMQRGMVEGKLRLCMFLMSHSMPHS